jgi:hypothetical protein
MRLTWADARRREREAIPREPSGVTLLLSATITPPSGVPGLVRTDPADRLRDYAGVLGFYLGLLGHSVDGLVFAENSGSDLAPLRALAARASSPERVEFVSFPGLDHPPAYGRAYGEFKLVDHVMSNSRLIRERPASAKVWKITGRYRVVNLRQLILRAPRQYDLYCNSRNWPFRWLDLGLIGWSVAGYDATLRGIYPELREDLLGDPPEIRMRSLVDRMDPQVRIVRRYTVEPRIDGIRGWDGRSYAHGINGLKFQVRRIARIVSPWIWI